MPIVKANQPLPPRPVVILIHGDPGCGKTTLANTCNNPILIDGDKGADRAKLRKDVLVPDSWDEILAEEAKGTLDAYKTLCLDTPKALIDDFMKEYVIRKDYKLKTNKMGMYGAIGDEFSLFVAKRQKVQSDIFIVCHSKKDEDKQLMAPDVTGGSNALLIRKADQVGYLTIRNGQRVIVFEPNDFSIGKNTAALPDMFVPPLGSPELENFGALIIEKTREAIATMNEEQTKALNASQELQDRISAAPAPYDLNGILAEVNKLPEYLKVPLKLKMKAKADASGWAFDKDKNAFIVAPTPAGTTGQAAPTPAAEQKPAEEVPPVQAAPVVQQEEEKLSDSDKMFEKMLAETSNDIPTEEIPKGKEKFKATYKHIETVEFVLTKATAKTDVSELYFANSDMIEQHPDFKAKLLERRNQLDKNVTANAA